MQQRGFQFQQKRLEMFSQGQQKRGSLERFEPNQSSGFLLGSQSTKNIALLGYSEISKIRDKVSRDQDPEIERRQKEREKLHDLSMKRVGGWGNTIYTVKKNQENYRFNKFQQEEEQRQKLDEEEKVFQENIKREVLDRANKLLYEKQDRVRSFQSKLLLSDALQERGEQLELNKRLQEMKKEREKMYEEEALQLMKEQDLENERKLEKQNEKKKQARKILKEQHEQMKQRFIGKMQEEYLDGQLRKAKVEEALEREKEDEKEKRRQRVQLQKEIREGNEILLAEKKRQEQKEKEEEERIEKYYQERQKVLQMKSIREEMKFKEKQEQKQRLIDAQAKRLAEIKNSEETRLQSQIHEAKQKAEDEEKKKEQRMKILEEKMKIAAEQTLARKKAQKEKEEQEDKKFQIEWIKKNDEIKKQELQSLAEAKEREKGLQEYHLKQIQNKEKLRETQFIEELDNAHKILSKKEQEDNQFNTWAQRAIQEWSIQGKDIYPMLKEIKDYSKNALK